MHDALCHHQQTAKSETFLNFHVVNEDGHGGTGLEVVKASTGYCIYKSMLFEQSLIPCIPCL